MPRTWQLERAQLLPCNLERAFDFFSNAGNLQKLTPPELNFRIVTPQPIEMVEGALIDYRLKLFGVGFKWRTRIDAYEPMKRFVDRQLRGPYRLWRHEHLFHETADGVIMIDRVDYQLPAWLLGRAAHALFVRSTLDRIFDFRRDSTAELLDEK